MFVIMVNGNRYEFDDLAAARGWALANNLSFGLITEFDGQEIVSVIPVQTSRYIVDDQLDWSEDDYR